VFGCLARLGAAAKLPKIPLHGQACKRVNLIASKIRCSAAHKQMFAGKPTQTDAGMVFAFAYGRCRLSSRMLADRPLAEGA
jgi:hypothetical protein